MVPGERILQAGEIELNAGRAQARLRVANTGDRPIQVGSHTHFFEVNPALRFDRAQAYGCRLDIPAGTSLRFEPGGLHLMLMKPLRPLAEGDTARLRLVLADGRRLYAEVPVRRSAP